MTKYFNVRVFYMAMSHICLKKSLIVLWVFSSLWANAVRSEFVFKGAGRNNIDVRLTLVKGDITKQGDVDILVNAANARMLGGAGVDGAIHNAAGPQLRQWIEENIKEISPHVRLALGDVLGTPSFNLKSRGVKMIVHTVGPDCRIKNQRENKENYLRRAYQNSLRQVSVIDWHVPQINGHLARGRLKNIAFPSISTGIYGYPVQEAASLAIQAIGDFIKQDTFWLDEVRFVLFSDADFAVYERALKDYAIKHR